MISFVLDHSAYMYVCIIVVLHVLNVLYVWGKYAYFNLFYNVNEFYVFQHELLHSPNKLPPDNCLYINGDNLR